MNNNIELVFSSGPIKGSTFSKIILLASKHSWLKSGKSSHLSIRFLPPEDNWMIESARHGFVPNFWPYFKDKNIIYKKFELKGLAVEVVEDVIEEFIRKNIYKPYDFLGVLGFGIVLCRYWLTGKKMKNPFSKVKTYMCSEVIYDIMKEVEKRCGVQYFVDDDRNLIFPDDLLLQCEKNYELFRETTNE